MRVLETDQEPIGTGETSVERQTLMKLRHLIDEGRYGNGDKLPPERQLADELHVSRHVLRNAFAVLEGEGKIWRGVGQGTFVGRRTPKTLGDVALVARSSSPVALLEARLSLEPIVTRFAAQRATSNHIQQMKVCVEKCQGAATIVTFEAWDEGLHALIVDAAQNAVFQAMYEMIRGVWDDFNWGLARQRSFTAEWRRVYSRQHRVIIEAIESRDLDRAENLMLEHWQTLRSNLLVDPSGKATLVR